MSTQDNTSLAAIVIAIIAFFVTTAQLLQQLFGTAVGYRSCQDSVIGEWSKLAKRHWRWSEFRFETKFQTPNIVLRPRPSTPFYASTNTLKDTYLWGDTLSRKHSLVPAIQCADENSDIVSWLRFMDQLHNYTDLWTSPKQGKKHETGAEPYFSKLPSKDSLDYITEAYPAITARQRSWDFMPQEITRPYATSNVGDVIILAHRLGMSWSDLRPADGVMRAEGKGRSIVSTTVRGFGLLLQFTHDKAAELKPEEAWREVTVPTVEADMLGFQIIPGFKDKTDPLNPNNLPDFTFDETNRVGKVRQVLEDLDLEWSAREMYDRYVRREHNYLGFSDLAPLVAPFMPLWGSSIVKLIAPHADVHDSPFIWREGFVVFQQRSHNLPSSRRSEQIDAIIRCFDELETHYGNTWMIGPSISEEGNDCPPGFVDKLHDMWNETSMYFYNLSSYPVGFPRTFRYSDLVGSQMLQSIHYPDLWEKESRPNKLQYYNLPSNCSARVCFAMHTYIDSIPKVVEEMARRGFDDLENANTERKASDLVEEAWWTMAFRAMLWHRAASWVVGPRPGQIFAAPSQFYGSKIPVFIA